MPKQETAEQMKRRLIADAADAGAWEPIAVVPASSAPRPEWYWEQKLAAARRARESRNARFEAAYRRHYDRVYRYFVRLRVPDADAHDLAQETFHRLYFAINDYVAGGERAAVEAIARDVISDRLRELKRVTRGAQVISIEEARAKRRLPPEQAHALEAFHRKQLHDAIAALPTPQREVVELWLDGFKYSDIARVLHVSFDAVKSTLRDAKHELRQSVDRDVNPPTTDAVADRRA